ncbi:hypothetical protein GCM10007966_08880 [Legionella impletisoli]|uniref:Integrase catalytic domain-containing protein n=1 Tax=Legionella impletisoli TaxID=343510 RepID=A0A917NAA1_9GAMM|nr:hypothetical protein GCM10007966_08880 [Legionella impletisoli]
MLIKEFFDDSKGRYGAIRIQQDLIEDGSPAAIKISSHAYRDLAKDHEFKVSMSRKGDCWDNAVAESFFHSLKVEAIQYEPIMTRAEMRQAVFEYIDIDYNRKRRHSAIGYTSPFNFELKKIA